MGIVEIIVILAVALIVIPPENLPDVMRAAGKVLRELRLASNLVMRELGGALDQPEDRPPPINTMKPGATASGANIAQTAATSDAPGPDAVKTGAANPAAAAPPAANATEAPTGASDAPKAMV